MNIPYSTWMAHYRAHIAVCKKHDKNCPKYHTIPYPQVKKIE